MLSDMWVKKLWISVDFNYFSIHWYKFLVLSATATIAVNLSDRFSVICTRNFWKITQKKSNIYLRLFLAAQSLFAQGTFLHFWMWKYREAAKQNERKLTSQCSEVAHKPEYLRYLNTIFNVCLAAAFVRARKCFRQ